MASTETSSQSRESEGRNGPQSRDRSRKPSRPPGQHRSSGSSSAVLRALYTCLGLHLAARRRPNAPLHEVQTLRTATTAPHRFQGHECEPTSAGVGVVGAKVAAAYVRKVAYRPVESDSFTLSVGERKSRQAGLQTRSPKLVNASLATAAQRRSQAHSSWRTALWESMWRVRTCGKQPIARQKATSRRSTSVEGRAVKPDYNHGPRSR
jgi:hypothetical protein